MAEIALETPLIKNWSIYKIVNPKGRVYIGITSNLKKRIAYYRNNSCKDQSLLYKSISKYGFDNHSFCVIDQFESDCNAAMGKEIFWIRTYMSNINAFKEANGLNLTRGGQGTLGVLFSAERRENLRRKATGRKHTEEQKKKIGDAKRGKPGIKGRKWSDEERKRRAITFKRGKVTEEQRMEYAARNLKIRGRPVIEYNQEGDAIKEYASIKIAAKSLGVNRNTLSYQLSGKQISTKTYIVKYK